MAKKGDYTIPFSKETGEIMSYAHPGDSRVEWRANYEFNDVLEFHEFERGRSAAHAMFISQNTKQTYPMFLMHLKEAIPYLVNGKLNGKFTFCKRGTNYGVAMVVQNNQKQKENANAMS